MPTVGYARVSSTGQDLAVQLEKLENAGCDKVFKEKRSGVDAGRPELKRCLEYLREGDTLLVTKIDRLARSTSDLYRIVSQLADKGVWGVEDDAPFDAMISLIWSTCALGGNTRAPCRCGTPVEAGWGPRLLRALHAGRDTHGGIQCRFRRRPKEAGPALGRSRRGRPRRRGRTPRA